MTGPSEASGDEPAPTLTPTLTTVVCLRREPYDVYMGRGGQGMDGCFGNPFPLRVGDRPGSTIPEFTAYFLERVGRDREFRRRVLELRGKRLGCFCQTTRHWETGKVLCHAQVVADWLNEMGDEGDEGGGRG